MAAAPGRLVGLLAHIHGAKALWMDRIRGTDSGIAVWPKWSLEDCTLRGGEVDAAWEAYAAALAAPELAREIAYRNSKGEAWSSRVTDILQHVVVHGGYHRGQIEMGVREAGGQPAYTDFIQAVRTGVLG